MKGNDWAFNVKFINVFRKVNLEIFHVCKSIAVIDVAHVEALLGLGIGVHLVDVMETVRRRMDG
jgi:hypothetical protein